MHHYLTPLKGVYSQPCLYSRCVNQPPFYSLDFYSSTIVESIFPSSLLTYCVHPCVIFTIFYTGKKPWNVSFLLAFQICFSSGQWNSLQKVAVWFTIICCGCELYYSAKKHSHCKTAVSIHGGLEESCRFIITSHIILKTLNPWSLFQSRGPPAWGHDWAEFQIGFPYHTGIPNIYYFMSWHLVIWRNFFFLMSLLFPLLWAKHRTCIGLLLLPSLYAASAVLYGPLNKECVV